MAKRRTILLLLPLLLLLSGCPQDPYKAALQGSADVSQAVSSAIKITATYYSAGTIDDKKKATVAGILDTVTNCNTVFRQAVVNTHNSGQTVKQSFLPIADSFVRCAQITPQVMNDPSVSAILKAVDTAINGLALAVQSAKGK